MPPEMPQIYLRCSARNTRDISTSLMSFSFRRRHTTQTHCGSDITVTECVRPQDNDLGSNRGVVEDDKRERGLVLALC